MPFALVDLVNDRGIEFEAGTAFVFGQITVKPTRASFIGAEQPAWLLEVEYEDYGIVDWLPLSVGADGRYQLLPHDWTYVSTGTGASGEAQVGDFTGDGLADVALAQYQHFAGRDFGTVTIYSWQAERLTAIGEVPLPVGSPLVGNTSTYVVTDADDDGLLELQVDKDVIGRFDCAWHQQDIYRWPDGIEQHTGGLEDAPRIAGCALDQVLTQTDSAAAIGWLETGLDRLTAADSADLWAWTYVQLGARYAAEGRDAEAATALHRLEQLAGDGAFADLARQAVSTYGAVPIAVCNALYGAAADLSAKESEPWFGSAIDDDLLLGGYPVDPYPYPPNVCPLPQLVAERLARAEWPADQDPAAGVQAQGFIVTASVTLPVIGGAQIWLGVAPLEQPQVVEAHVVDGRWRYRVVDSLRSAIEAVNMAAYQPNSDRQPVALVSAVYSEPVSRWDWFQTCAAGERALVAMQITPGDAADKPNPTTVFCGPPAQISLTSPTDQKRVSDLIAEAMVTYQPPEDTDPAWVRLEGLDSAPSDETNLFMYLEHLRERTMLQAAPADVAQELAALLAYLPDDDAAAQLVALHGRYLHALNEELRGDTDFAAHEYVGLVADAPYSVWAWLAWARLEPDR